MSDTRERLEKIRDQLTDAAALCAEFPAMVPVLPQVTGQLAKVLAQLDALPPAVEVVSSLEAARAKRDARKAAPKKTG